MILPYPCIKYSAHEFTCARISPSESLFVEDAFLLNRYLVSGADKFLRIFLWHAKIIIDIVQNWHILQRNMNQ